MRATQTFNELMENKEKVIDDYPFSLKFTGFSWTNIVMSCCIDFNYSLCYRDYFHPLWHVRRLSGVVYWFLLPLPLSQLHMSTRPQKAIYHQFIIKKILH